MVGQQPEPQWQPLSKLWVIISIVSGMLEDTQQQYQLLLQAQDRPGALDDATVQHAQRVYRQQLDDLRLYEEQCKHWLTETDSPRQRKRIERTAAKVPKIRETTQSILELLDYLAEQTIERMMAKSDLELGVEAVERDRDRTPPASENERRARQIDNWVLGIIKRNGGDEAILMGMYDYMPIFKKILDTASPGEIERLCEEYMGFYHFAKLLEDLAGGIAVEIFKCLKYFTLRVVTTNRTSSYMVKIEVASGEVS